MKQINIKKQQIDSIATFREQLRSLTIQPDGLFQIHTRPLIMGSYQDICLQSVCKGKKAMI